MSGKHMELRFQAPDNVLVADMERLAAELENMGYDQMVELAQQTQEVTVLDHMISRIDAIQAELWRRSQRKQE
jgi:hypothetical protein